MIAEGDADVAVGRVTEYNKADDLFKAITE